MSTSLTRLSKSERECATDDLRAILPPGKSVSAVVTHVARSGMSRCIRFLIAREDDTVQDISWMIGRALGYNVSRDHGGLRISGGGMDMAFHVIHSLSYALHGMESVGPDALKAQASGTPFSARNGQFRAGYSLRYEGF